MVTRKRIKTLMLTGAALILGFLAGSVFGFPATGPLSRERDLMEWNRSGVFTNPLLACGDIDNLSVGAMQNLKDDITNFIQKRKEAGHISHVSVYVRDLNNGPWLGINEKEPFYPASLLKVPLLLATYKVEEDYPGFLEEEITYTEPLVVTPQLFPPSEPLVPGTYTIRELLRRSIVFSDNNATALLAAAIGPDPALEVFEDFGIEKPTANVDYQMLVRTYASFFRVLYNASYVSRKHSEEALKLLSEVDFDGALVAGVPDGVPVAHKFGEREAFSLTTGDLQIHDCGIVYSRSPYLICVMAQGKSATNMLSVIREISKKAYETVSDGA